MKTAERQGRSLTDKLGSFRENAERGICYTANFGWGYVQEQLFTTLNLLLLDIARKYVPIKPEYESDYESDLIEEFRTGDSLGAGMVLGAAQDLASLALSVNYLCGNDSRLAHIATGVVAAKIGLNVLSLAAQGIYLRAKKNSKPNLELRTD